MLEKGQELPDRKLWAYLIFKYMGILPECLYTTYVECLQRPEQGVRCSGTGVTASCEQVSAGNQTPAT